ncbi:methyltransferase [Streptomyces sp. NPDC085529]|uniref:methyltransferase n=1 Tax=Streptomyces sp. NPDC085529 TaxID=3365729 RepID=UPI0037D944AB
MAAAASAPGPITRQTILETLLAFKRTSLLRTAIELRLFDALTAGPHGADHVAHAIGAPARATRILLTALASAGLVTEHGAPGQEKFGLVEGADSLLVTTSPHYAGDAALVAASQQEWQSMGSLTDIVRTGSTHLDQDAGSPDFPYWQDFAAHGTFATRPVAEALADALGTWAAGREEIRLLDVGCGHALFGLHLARTFDHARVVGIDWASILPHARRNARTMGLADRATWIAGDAFEQDLQGPYDLVVLANFLPQFSEEDGIRLLRRVRSALAPGGRVALAGFTVGDFGPPREFGGRMLSLLLLAWTRGGEVPTTEGYVKMLRHAGFADPDVYDTPGLPTRLFIAAPH